MKRVVRRRRKKASGTALRRVKRRRNPAKKTAAKKAPARKKSPARKARRVSAKRSPAKKAAATRKRSTVKKTAAKKSSAKKSAAGKKAAATRKANKAKRSAAAKKGARKRMTRAQALKRARAARKVGGEHMQAARRALKKGGKRSTRRAIARTYVRARSIAQRSARGRLSGEDQKLAKAMGLTRINPSWKAVGADAKVLAKHFALGGVGAIGGVALSLKAGTWIGGKLPEATPAFIKKNAIPLTAWALAGGVWAGLKMSKKAQKWSLPIGLGMGGAAALLTVTHTEMGQKLLAKMGIKIAVAAVSGESGSTTEAPGMGAYISTPGYMGEFVPALEGYIASDYPVHRASPGDNINPTAVLEGMGQGIFSGMDDDDMDYTLEETPGGTVVLGGIFDGDSVI